MSARIIPEDAYIAAVKRLPPDRKKAANAALGKFMKEPRLPSLDFRPLVSMTGYFIIDSNRGDRIILHREEDDEDGTPVYSAVDVGPHDNVYRRWNRLR